MRARTGVAVAAFSCLWLVGAHEARAASFDCSAARLSATQIVICTDTELSQTDERTDKRIRGLQRRLGFGFYLGIRYWYARSNDQRDACEANRACIVAAYRAQNRTLNRLIECLDSSARKRACLRVTLNTEAAAAKRPP